MNLQRSTFSGLQMEAFNHLQRETISSLIYRQMTSVDPDSLKQSQQPPRTRLTQIASLTAGSKVPVWNNFQRNDLRSNLETISLAEIPMSSSRLIKYQFVLLNVLFNDLNDQAGRPFANKISEIISKWRSDLIQMRLMSLGVPWSVVQLDSLRADSPTWLSTETLF